ncbi:hypothetical protein REPUB_Repub14bG0022700 [Reevesia pubescens]
MGNASSMLTQYDIDEVQEYCNNLFSQQEIVSLYQRFCQLDQNAKRFISADEFLSVPEFAMNQLSQRLLKMVDGLNFKDFVAFLSAFRSKCTAENSTSKNVSKLANVINFLTVSVIFKVYDYDCNGKVPFNDILEVLRDLSGSFISDDQREQVLTQLLEEAGYSRDSYLMLPVQYDPYVPQASMWHMAQHGIAHITLYEEAHNLIRANEFKNVQMFFEFGLLNCVLAYFTESPVLELIHQGRASNMFETQTCSSEMGLGSSGKKFPQLKNIKAASSRKHTITRIAGNWASGAEELNTRVVIPEEEKEILKQAFLETVVERKKLVDELCQLFQTLHCSLHCKGKKDGHYGSLIIKPTAMGLGDGAAAASSLSQALLENPGFGRS